jgi:DNA repair protein RecN (Recombination protein N)
VAKKLGALSADYQTLVITHLHQIAALSEHHYAVEKVAIGSPGRKIISIHKLNRSERQKEIRRMLSLPESSKV